MLHNVVKTMEAARILEMKLQQVQRVCQQISAITVRRVVVGSTLNSSSLPGQYTFLTERVYASLLIYRDLHALFTVTIM